MADQVFPGGVRVFNPHDNAPDFVKGSLVITLNDLVQFGKDNPGLLSDYNGQKQLKIKLLESKEGKLYCVVDDFKPGEKKPKERSEAANKFKDSLKNKVEQEPIDDLPF